MNNDLMSIKNLLCETILEKQGSYIVEELFKRFPSIQEILQVTEEELVSLNGIGPKKAKQILSILELGRRLAAPPSSERTVVRCPADAHKVLKPHFQYEPNEKFAIIGLDVKNQVKFDSVVSTGTVSSCLVTPLIVFRPLIKRNCSSVILGHLHPSQILFPSTEDLAMTKRLVECGELLNIAVLDHLICNDTTFLSLKEDGHM